MQDKDSDIFELNKNNSLGVNRFLNDKNPFINGSFGSEHINRLNDYDSNILQEGAYKNMPDDVFKLEYRISRAEADIKAIESQMHTAFEIGDNDIISELQHELDIKKDVYNSLLELYNQTALSAKITDSLSCVIGKFLGTKINSMVSLIKKVCDKIISKMPVQISSIFKIKKSLLILKNINKNVDSLITTTVPYGENTDKYRQLSKYIIKANSIQSEISDYLKKNS